MDDPLAHGAPRFVQGVVTIGMSVPKAVLKVDTDAIS